MPDGADRLRRAATTVKLGSTTMRVSVVGDGPTVLLCSGLSSPLETWGSLIDHLSPAAHRFVAFDVPGVGESPNTCRPVRIGRVATLAARLLDHVDVARAHVIGYSWGGAVAQHFAWRESDRLDRLVLASTSVGLGGVPGHPFAVGHLASTTVTGLMGQVGAIATWSSLPWLRHITAPTLVLAGSDDLLVPPLNAHLLGWAISQAEVKVLPGLGHPLFDAAALDVVGPRIEQFFAA